MAESYRVLAIVRGGMGDLVLTLPLLQSVKAANSRAEITVLATNQRCLDAAGFLAGRSAMDAVIDWRTVGYSACYKLAVTPDLGRLIDRSDRVLCLDCEDPRAFLTMAAGDREKVVPIDYRPAPHQKQMRMWEVLIRHARDAGVELRDDPVPRIGLEHVGSEPDLVVLAPGAGEVLKVWPVAGWITVAEWYKACGRRVAWSLGPQEKEHPMYRPIWGRDEPRIEDGTLGERMRTICRAGLVISSDSGILHLAAAAGVPKVRCIWNEFGMRHNYPFWASPCPNVTHVLPDSPLNPPLEKVIAGVE